MGYIANTSPQQFRANRVTRILASPVASAAIIVFSTGPAAQALPAFAAENQYQDITDSQNSPFQKAFGTDKPCLQWLTEQPNVFGAL
ncbi:hypothetical protein BDV29DRAFT_155570 [Aspergillus leporis]|uniref:Uncharacterized protein n=1 Tax=Aspergillus leporis TaxID=41062 RepID=A0A5N5X5Z9_9EURO|nr:hypothetical protein BDV29DRAFT_155570 [Aspergillus leporis]